MIREVSDLLYDYAKNLFETGKRGDTREESFYGDLSNLLENYAHSNGLDEIHVTTLPKQTETGNPDFRIWDGTQEITGYIEAKRPSKRNLDVVEDTEQLERYRNSFPNLILTNFFEFRLYRHGELVDKATLSYPGPINEIKNPPSFREPAELFELLDKFFAFSVPKIDTAEKLAVELAKKTKFLRDDVLKHELQENDENDNRLRQFHEAFQEYLIGGIDEEDFADLYAQTITYGLFAARTRSGTEFNRRLAYDQIPSTIGILREIFQYISLGEVPAQLEWIVDDISEVLAKANVGDILEGYFHEGRGEDPVVHFYETFLAEYDPETRERRGVYYTPEPVVSYITRSINKLLKKHFGRTDGLADNGVKVLDPAAGTTTFLGKAAQIAVNEFEDTYGEGGVEGFISDHILEDFYGFELMMAPYAIGHLKMSYMLEEMGHELKQEERFKLYLTNTLEMEELEQSRLPGMSSLSEESHLAGEVKKETPILAIMGNPPYSVRSSNTGDWIVSNLKEGYQINDDRRQGYYEVDGNPLEEKNPKNLLDDYVKFLRFAQWKIDQREKGIVGFITNHSYLDNPTFRGMRQSLLKTFDHIYLLDLHGNSLRRESCPDGSKDENVFNIRQGVAIGLFLKAPDLEKKVFREDLWGEREIKYDWLSQNSVSSTDWEPINPKSNLYFFVDRDESLLEQYERHPKVDEIFKQGSTGIKTHRDFFVIDTSKQKLKRRIEKFRSSEYSDKEVRETFGLTDNQDWKMAEKRKKIMEDEDWEDKIHKILYRPFDERWIFYHYHAIDRGREEIMQHMLNDNLGIGLPRRLEINQYSHVFLTETLLSNHSISIKEGNYLFPLYVYPQSDPNRLFSKERGDSAKESNVKNTLLNKLIGRYDSKVSPLNVLDYIYAILTTNTYREKYEDFLRRDFPRIPFTADYDLFEKIVSYGHKLRDLHLLNPENEKINSPIAKFKGKGSNKVAKPKRVGRNYKPDERRVYINKDKQYFENIIPKVWEYDVGGYQVLDKWLKDRREKKLSTREIRTFCKIVTAIEETIKLQKSIDEVYPGVEVDTIDFNLGEGK